MKKILLYLMIFTTIALSTGCLSSNKTFGVETEASDFISEYRDEFTDKVTVLPTKKTSIFGDSWNGGHAIIRPYFIGENDVWACHLQVVIPFISKKANRIVLLSDSSRIILPLDISFEDIIREQPYCGTILADPCYNLYGDFLITEEQYIEITKFFTEGNNIQAAVYFIDNKVGKFTENKNTAKKTYSSMFDYYTQKSLSGKILPVSNIKIEVK